MFTSFFHYTLYFCVACVTLISSVNLMASFSIGIVPSEPAGLSEHIYRYNPNNPNEYLNNWKLIDRVLQTHDMKLQPTKLSEFTDKKMAAQLLKNMKKIIFCNIPWWLPNWKEKLALLPPEKLILIAYEPPAVLPEMYSEQTLALFGKVLTWNDSLVDNVKFFKFNYACLYQMTPDVVPFSQKKFLTQISGNKTSSHPNELYSKRLNVIRYFEKDSRNDFDFYGFGWQNEGYKNYKGAPADKIGVLKNYKFSICYENICEVKGYITEKIFDCFAAGVVPIYWGASNVSDYIPANCFIARKDFPPFKNLVKYLRNMKEDRYNLYLDFIRVYLKSEKAQQFTHEAFAHSVLKCLRMDQQNLSKNEP
jgi:alpha(1,3/1,4) fucosyltransferase